MKIAFIEEDLLLSGGIRRVLEVSNRLVDKGHKVDILILLDEVALKCDWMECKANIKRIDDRSDYDIAIMNHAPAWLAMESVLAKVKVYWWLGFEAGYFERSTWYDAYQQPYKIIANSEWTADMAEIIYGKRPPVIYGGIDKKQFYPIKVKKEYDVLTCVPEDRPEKGHFIIKRACNILGLQLENFAIKDLPQDKLAEEYSKAKVFVGMPIIEGFYYPALEAMACGTPVIMTNAGGNMCYAKDGENCLVIPRNVGYLVQALKRLKPKLLIKNGLETVNKYDWDKTANELEALCEEYLGEEK